MQSDVGDVFGDFDKDSWMKMRHSSFYYTCYFTIPNMFGAVGIQLTSCGWEHINWRLTFITNFSRASIYGCVPHGYAATKHHNTGLITGRLLYEGFHYSLGRQVSLRVMKCINTRVDLNR